MRTNGQGRSRIGRSTHNRPDRITIATLWAVYGGRNRCQVCDGQIGHLDLDFEIDAELPTGQKVLHFHALCYDQWVTRAGSLEMSVRLAALFTPS